MMIARIFAHVGHVAPAGARDGGADQSAIEGHLFVGIEALAEADGVVALQHLVFFVQQPDGEHVVVDQAAQQLPDPLEQRVEIENRGELAADLVHHRERLRLARDARIQARILDGLRRCATRSG